MDYTSLKLVHMTTAALSISGFIARGIGVGLNASWPASRLARTLPHINDTVLLLSALLLAWISNTTPLNAAWLSAKVVALVLYIVLGMIALRPGRPRWMRLLAWCAALAVFAYIVSVAFSKSVSGWWPVCC